MKRSLLVLAALLLAPGSAAAASWYVSGTGSYVWRPQGHSLVTAVPGSDSTVKYNDGHGLGLAVGYAFDNHLRVEGELARRVNRFDSVAAGGGAFFADIQGPSVFTTGLVNIYYDIETPTPLTPYIGAGAGLTRVRQKIFAATLGGDNANDRDYVGTYQLSAGVSYRVTPRVSVFTGYRYMGYENVRMTAFSGTISKFDETRTQEAQAGLRYHF